ncbi:MAG TPA: hypothetical protein V6C57_19940 [Coleofasciculaceae cyanobacterium]
MVKVLTLGSNGQVTEVDVLATSSAIAWTVLPLATGWSVVSGFATPSYRVVPGGRVVAKGAISKSGLITQGDTIATFPVNFRPKEQRGFTVPTAAGPITLVVKPTGEIIYGGSLNLSGAAQLSLDSIEFDAEQ